MKSDRSDRTEPAEPLAPRAQRKAAWRTQVCVSDYSEPRECDRRNLDPGTSVMEGTALELAGIYEGPNFIGVGPDSVRRVRQFASILRGDLLTYRDTYR